jgi:FkbM family methyltransferase
MANPLLAVASRLNARLFHASPSYRRHSAELVTRSFEELSYHHLIEHGFRPAGIIDVGAFRGDWTRMANRLFGATPTLMVEAQPKMQAEIAPVLADLPQAKLAGTVLGERSGEEVTFYEMGTGSSFLPEASDAARTELKLTTRTLDEVADEALPGLSPLFLKVDVQGAELHVLRGGARTLERTEVVQLEVAMLQYNEGAPLMPEVIAFMAERDFLPIEVSGFSRPKGYLVQIDLLFARRGSKLRPDYFRFS